MVSKNRFRAVSGRMRGSLQERPAEPGFLAHLRAHAPESLVVESLASNKVDDGPNEFRVCVCACEMFSGFDALIPIHLSKLALSFAFWPLCEIAPQDLNDAAGWLPGGEGVEAVEAPRRTNDLHPRHPTEADRGAWVPRVARLRLGLSIEK